ncbi:WYL domain-containing protein [Nocardioides marmoriginsengisoli]|uniref:WYL domain-containing protein n=2 Tax=Nocardioides marmoriginsengisoli TaxID=661483 RepID=A0A3N0CPL0_9ACTN|nr:WYL domain-containing protein [Nocardioides marmoriginsengisoli]
MERLVRLVAVLHQAGRHGVAATNLAEIAGFDGEDTISQLGREFRHLRALGWQIDNVGGEGNHGIYRMVTVDNRIAVKLTPEQQAALLRAVLLVNRDDLVERLGLPASERPADVITAVPGDGDQAMSTVSEALRLGCILRFRYAGSLRTVHPESARTQNGTWYLRGHEDGSDVVKSFVISRMSEVAADATTPAVRLETSRHPGLNPMSWEIDPPVEVTLRAPAEFAPDVRRWLGAPASEREAGNDIELTYVVTHRAALRSRIYELGPRVQVLGPDEIRTELLDELAFMAGE